MCRGQVLASLVQGLVGSLRWFLRPTTLHLHGLLHPFRGMAQPFDCPLQGLHDIVWLRYCRTLWQDDGPSIADKLRD